MQKSMKHYSYKKYIGNDQNLEYQQLILVQMRPVSLDKTAIISHFHGLKNVCLRIKIHDVFKYKSSYAFLFGENSMMKTQLQENSSTLRSTLISIFCIVLGIWTMDDSSAADIVLWQVQVGLKISLGPPAGLMLGFVSPWCYWVSHVPGCRVYCLLNCLHSTMG